MTILSVVYYNYTGNLECLDLGSGGDTPDLGYNAWYYQTCTEFVMPFCSDGKEGPESEFCL